VAGVDITAKQQMSRLLLESGATINEINTVRKHLSRIKGGNLCTYTGKAQLVSLILSDVIGDDLQVIASGLTAPDSTTFSDCFQIFDQYHLWDALPAQVANHFTRARAGKAAETPKPDSPTFQRVFNLIIGSNSLALQAAADEAAERGFPPLVLTSMLKGEAREAGLVLTSIAKEIQRSGSPIASPACLLSGGETTVTLAGNGLGGRNMELALAASFELDQTEGILLLSAGTDGTDGPTDSAGAFADGTTAARAKSRGLSPLISLKNNDSYNFFKEIGDLLCTGPTRTNVMDLQIFLIASCS
jgi:hydroxypyruvate reductase